MEENELSTDSIFNSSQNFIECRKVSDFLVENAFESAYDLLEKHHEHEKIRRISGEIVDQVIRRSIDEARQFEAYLNDCVSFILSKNDSIL